MTDYQTFLESKRITTKPSGFSVNGSLNPLLFDFQNDIDLWALARGRAAIFSACGTGKTPMELAFGDAVVRHMNDPVLVVAPLAVSHQTIREAKKFGFEAQLAISDDDIKKPGIYVTNYEKLDNFPHSKFAGVILDESSRL